MRFALRGAISSVRIFTCKLAVTILYSSGDVGRLFDAITFVNSRITWTQVGCLSSLMLMMVVGRLV